MGAPHACDFAAAGLCLAMMAAPYAWQEDGAGTRGGGVGGGGGGAHVALAPHSEEHSSCS